MLISRPLVWEGLSSTMAPNPPRAGVGPGADPLDGLAPCVGVEGLLVEGAARSSSEAEPSERRAVYMNTNL